MFDTPDLRPLCVAPFVAILVGLATFGISSFLGSLAEKKIGRKEAWIDPLILMIAIASIPIACFTSLILDIGTISPTPRYMPKTSYIAGSWELSSTTTKFLKEWYGVSVSTHELVFEDDGTFHLRNIPTFWGLLDTNLLQIERYISGVGTWHLEQIEGREHKEWIIFAQFEEINGHPDSRFMRFYFEGRLPPFTLGTLDSAGLLFEFNKK